MGNLQYSVDQEIAHFFERTSTTRSSCDSYAKKHLGGDVVPVAMQGVCSYTVEAGPNHEFVAQFRLKSHLIMLTIRPDRFYALSWKSPQNVDQAYRDSLRYQYENQLELLNSALPCRFHSLIRKSLESLPAIPIVLLHKDFGVCNIMVNETSCNLVGVIDWAEAEIGPFGLNLYSHQRLISKVHLESGWARFDDYVTLEEMFWRTFSEEAGGLSSETIAIIKSAMILGTLLSCGFTSRLANMPKPVPIQDNENRAYNTRDLDGLLINPATKFTELV